ncbi:hypothetical protein KVP09_03415 [Alcaligenaceae bacterium CGII-47]|nr:hypothetical protein [Alcaligenaceae bacterium CGII-47]
MDAEIKRIHQTTVYPTQSKAHMPPLPEPDKEPNLPPNIPPIGPDEVELPVDLPSRENPPDIRDPNTTLHEYVSYLLGHRIE